MSVCPEKIAAAAKAAGIDNLDSKAAAFVLGYQAGAVKKDSPPDAIRTCACGKVRIQFCASKGHTAGKCGVIECGCCDCRARLAYCESLGGPKMMQLPQLLYFPNDIRVLSGKDLLTCFKTNELSATPNVMSTCCNTWLLAVHPFYQGRLTVTFHRDNADPETKVDSGAASQFENLQPVPGIAYRFCEQDLTKEFIKEHPYKGPYGHNFSTAIMTYEQILNCVGWIFPRIDDFELTTEGQTVESLIEEIGGAKVVNFKGAEKLSANGSGQPGSDLFNKVILPMMKAEAEAKEKAEAEAKAKGTE